MKILCVAHPDDEVIWFNPEEFDRIFIVFGDRLDKPWMNTSRQNALAEHPLREKIVYLNVHESGYWKNKDYFVSHQKNYQKIVSYFDELPDVKNIEAIFTHNAEGEYGHSDHIMLHDIVKRVFYYGHNVPVWVNTDEHTGYTSTTNNKIFNQIKALYSKHGIWTWEENYSPPQIRYYRRVI